MSYKSIKRATRSFFSPEVVLSNSPLDVIRDPKEVDEFIKGLYNTQITEVYNKYYVNPRLCTTIKDRSWVFSRRTFDNTVTCVQSAAWVYTNYKFGDKFVVNNNKITLVDKNLFITDHFLYKEDVIKIKDLYITTPERTLIDIIRLCFNLNSDNINTFKYIEDSYKISEEKLISCLYRMKNFKNINHIAEILYKHNFIKDMIDFK